MSHERQNGDGEKICGLAMSFAIGRLRHRRPKMVTAVTEKTKVADRAWWAFTFADACQFRSDPCPDRSVLRVQRDQVRDNRGSTAIAGLHSDCPLGPLGSFEVAMCRGERREVDTGRGWESTS